MHPACSCSVVQINLSCNQKFHLHIHMHVPELVTALFIARTTRSWRSSATSVDAVALSSRFWVPSRQRVQATDPRRHSPVLLRRVDGAWLWEFVTRTTALGKALGCWLLQATCKRLKTKWSTETRERILMVRVLEQILSRCCSGCDLHPSANVPWIFFVAVWTDLCKQELTNQWGIRLLMSNKSIGLLIVIRHLVHWYHDLPGGFKRNGMRLQ